MPSTPSLPSTPRSANRNVSWDLIDQAARQPDAPAFLLEDRDLSYAELDARVWRCARVLAEAGAQPGRIVGLALRDELPFALALLACTRLGAPFTVLSTAQSDRERLPIDLLVIDPGARSPDSTLRAVTLDLSDLDAEPATPDPGLMPAYPDSPWQFLIGSGSTGTPKVMPISHRVQNARAVAARSIRNLRSADRFLCLPAMDTHFCRTQMFYALHAGAAFVLRKRPASRAIQMCQRYRVSILDAASVHLEELLASVPLGSEELARQALRTVRMLMVTSSAVSDDLRRRVQQRLTDRLVILYSTNESSPISMAGGPRLCDVPGTVGRVLLGVEVRILGPEDIPVPGGEVGVLEVRSPGVIEGYHDDPVATQKAFRDGWFRTGDLVRALPDGQLVYCGRADHMMIMNGINIHPAEIERTLCEHPAVADAAAVPLRHPVHQEIPVCAVVLRPGIPVTDSELMAFASQRLGFRGPRGIVPLNEIPRNAQGKLQRDRVIEAVARRANITGCA